MSQLSAFYFENSNHCVDLPALFSARVCLDFGEMYRVLPNYYTLGYYVKGDDHIPCRYIWYSVLFCATFWSLSWHLTAQKWRWIDGEKKKKTNSTLNHIDCNTKSSDCNSLDLTHQTIFARGGILVVQTSA